MVVIRHILIRIKCVLFVVIDIIYIFLMKEYCSLL